MKAVFAADFAPVNYQLRCARFQNRTKSDLLLRLLSCREGGTFLVKISVVSAKPRALLKLESVTHSDR